MIEWTDETWNPVTGCTKISAGCANCYAERMARRLAGRFGYPEAPHHFDVTLHEDKLELPLKWKQPRKIFVCSMGDLFHENVPVSYIWRVIELAYMCDRHIFQILTKRPKRMVDILTRSAWWNNDFPKNIQLGVSIEDQETSDRRIYDLLGVPAALHFVSAEPLLGPIQLELEGRNHGINYSDWAQTIDWVICGGESGPNARLMNIEWARSLRDQCIEAGVPFFFKQHGMYLHKSQMIRGVHFGEHETRPAGNGYVKCTSKYAAGNLLDGKIYHEYPIAGPPA
jgi:protein gp37